MNAFFQWAISIPWFAWIAIFAILGGSCVSIAKIVTEHLEKMERIRNGMQ